MTMAGEARNILVINLTRLGDILQSTPLLQALKAECPSPRIDYLAVSGFAEICRMIPQIDRVIPFDFNGAVAASKGAVSSLPRRVEELRGFFDGLAANRYDTVINLSHSRISALVCYLLNAPDTRGLTLDSEGYRQIRHPWARYFFTANLNRLYNRFNLVDIHLGLAREHDDGSREAWSAGGRRGLSLQVSEAARTKARSLLEGWNGQEAPVKIGFQPGASLASKRWPAASFTALGQLLRDELRAGIVVFGSPAERELAGQVAKPLGDAALNLAGRTDLESLAAALQQVDLLVTNDTGTQHVAAAVGTPVLSLCFGSALSHETGPYGQGHAVIEAAMDCFPCNFQVQCTRYRCQERVQPEAVSLAVRNMLERPAYEIWPDDPRFEGLNLWRTRFDADGFWTQAPAVRRLLETHQFLNLVIREIWKDILLAPGGKPRPEPAVLHKVAEALTEYQAPDLPRFSEQIAQCQSAFAHIQELAGTGMTLCRELERLGRHPAGDLERMRQIGERLAGLDRNLEVIGLRLPAVNHLVLDFIFGKQNLQGHQVPHLAAQTLLLYHRLADGADRFHAALQEWKTLFRRLEWIPDPGSRPVAPLPGARETNAALIIG
ncbi:MAG: glycosyltransferase family 9 protein [Candidatus Zixiibacteriota bacterium]|nr:MAG: glycosyltransferase family 9 protein [candidate division Zixibacteria bacterium]